MRRRYNYYNPLAVEGDDLPDYYIRLKPYGISNQNPYVPMFAYFTGTLINKGNEKAMIYTPVVTHDFGSKGREHRDIIGKKMFKNLESGTRIKHFVYDEEYFIDKNCIFQIDKDLNVNFLMMVVVESDYFMSTRTRYKVLDQSKLLMLLSTDLNFSKHDSIRRRIKTFHENKLKSIDVLTTSDISKWCFNNNLKNIKFDDLTSRAKFINQIKSMSYGKKPVYGFETEKEFAEPVKYRVTFSTGTGQGTTTYVPIFPQETGTTATFALA